MGTVAAVANLLIRKDVVHTAASVGPACICCPSVVDQMHGYLRRSVQWLSSFNTQAAHPWILLRTIDVVDGGTWRCCQHCCDSCWPHCLTTNAHMAQAAQQWLATTRLKQWLTDGWHKACADNAVLLDQRSHSLHILQLLRRRHDYGAASGYANPEVKDMHICKAGNHEQIQGMVALCCQPSGWATRNWICTNMPNCTTKLRVPKLSAIQFSILSPAPMPACFSSASL